MRTASLARGRVEAVARPADGLDKGRTAVGVYLVPEVADVAVDRPGESPVAALEIILRSAPPDVILLDLRLPDIDGNDVVLRLRTGARTSCIPVVALTALVSLGDALVDAGFDGFLSKPIDVRAFPNQVRKYCRRRPA